MLELTRLHDASMRASCYAVQDREVEGREAVHAMHVQAALLQVCVLGGRGLHAHGDLLLH